MGRGTVKWFDSKKGFGFIVNAADEKDIFVHYSNIQGNDFRSLKHGQEVEFDFVDSEKGPQARNVRLCPKVQADSEP